MTTRPYPVGGKGSSESTRVVYAALAGNVLVAASKFVAAALSGSSAMLTEAVHSTADTINQLLLLLGKHRAGKPADLKHPFGYDGERYFWAFVVAIMVLLAGGAASIFQGVQELRHPRPIEAPGLSLGVLGLSVLFEGGSLAFSYRTYRRIVSDPGTRRGSISLWSFIKGSKDPNLYESLLEDTAALVGIALAAAGVLGSVWLHRLWMDGAASIAIGLVLIADSYVITYATRSLIVGEGVLPAVRTRIIKALEEGGFDDGYTDLQTLQLGPDSAIVFLAVREGAMPADQSVATHLEAVRRCIERADKRLRHVFPTVTA